MSFKVFLLICLQLILTSGQQMDLKSTPIPASVVALGLLLCLCYCLLGSCRDSDRHPMYSIQPVVVTNRNSPLVISAQSNSQTNSGPQASSSSAPHQLNRNNTGKKPSVVGQNKTENTVPAINQRKTEPQMTANTQSTGTPVGTRLSPVKASPLAASPRTTELPNQSSASEKQPLRVSPKNVKTLTSGPSVEETPVGDDTQ